MRTESGAATDTLKSSKPRSARSSRRANKGCCIRADLRLAIFLRDGGICLYCLADLHGAAPFDVTMDHVIPQADGGTNAPQNLLLACRTCNCTRQDKPLARFCGPETRAHIRRNLRRSIAPYRKLAKAMIEGRTGDNAAK